MKRPRAPMSSGKRFRIWRRDDFRCTYCGTSAFDLDVVLEVDHIIAVSAGGTDDPENLTTACRACNWRKGPHRPRAVVDGVRVTYSLPLVMARRIARIAQAEGVTPPHVVRRLLAEALEREPERVA